MSETRERLIDLYLELEKKKSDCCRENEEEKTDKKKLGGRRKLSTIRGEKTRKRILDCRKR